MNINIMHDQIINLFASPEETMSSGLWFSGYKKDGEFKEWYDNGQLYAHCFYKDGKKNGQYKEWWINGTLFMHKLFKDGKEVEDYLK